jgi:hypothetical protein
MSNNETPRGFGVPNPPTKRLKLWEKYPWLRKPEDQGKTDAEIRAEKIRVIKQKDLPKAAKPGKPKEIKEISDREFTDVLHQFKSYRQIQTADGEQIQKLHADKDGRVWTTMTEGDLKEAAENDAAVSLWLRLKCDCIDVLTPDELFESYKEQRAFLNVVESANESYLTRVREIYDQHADEMRQEYFNFHSKKADFHQKKLNELSKTEEKERA